MNYDIAFCYILSRGGAVLTCVSLCCIFILNVKKPHTTGPFCNGEAHSEVANMAERVWELSGERIMNLFEEYPDYELVLTGHSLGAGAACLLNIMLHENESKIVKGRRIRCFSFASPPVFSAISSIPIAMENCVNYIHQRDIVPFLSLDALRHLLGALNGLSEFTESMPIWKRWQLTAGIDEIDKQMIAAINKGRTERLPSLDGAPLLAVPALANVWMIQSEESKKYDFCLCDPEEMAKVGLLLNPFMILDHVPINYERALIELCDEFEDDCIDYSEVDNSKKES